MATVAQDKGLTSGVKPPIPGTFKGSMDSKTILNFIYKYELYFSLISISNRYLQALFTVRLL